MYKLQTQRNDEGACRMKKWIYLLIVTVTIYLNLLYEWKEGGSVLAAEIIFYCFV